jgi:hypothetical protein
MRAFPYLVFASAIAAACGSAVDVQGPGAGGTATSTGPGASGGGGASSGGSGPGGSTTGGSGGSDATCAGLAYCDCIANEACSVVAEDCFCPCGVEPCRPDCECDCGGGQYLGCAPTSIMNPGALDGVWLVGWSGGAHHYSWVRFEADGALTVNDGASLQSNVPFYPCSGPGSWIFTAQPETVGLTLAGGCGFSTLHFVEWTGTPAWPTGCLQAAIVEDGITPAPLMACRFPASQCDASLSSCTDPLAP